MEIAKRIQLREVSDHDPVYLSLIRQCPCLCCMMDPAGVATHVRYQSAAHGKREGMSRKPNDKFAVPLCPSCHTDGLKAQHKIGERAFWSGVGIDPLLVCNMLYPKRGDIVAMRAVVYLAIAERESRAQSLPPG
jgi:hypothetical protein